MQKLHLKPQITADEAIFSLVMMLQHKEYSHSVIDMSHKKEHRSRKGTSRLNDVSGSVLSGDSIEDIGIALSQAYQRLLAYQADDGSFSFTKWNNK